MTITNLMSQRVTIVRRWLGVNIDEYGNDLPTENVMQTTGYLQQNARTEREGTVPEEGWLLALPARTAIRADDSVIVDGETYRVAGPPWPVIHPRTGIEHHVEATLTQTEGGGDGS